MLHVTPGRENIDITVSSNRKLILLDFEQPGCDIFGFGHSTPALKLFGRQGWRRATTYPHVYIIAACRHFHITRMGKGVSQTPHQTRASEEVEDDGTDVTTKTTWTALREPCPRYLRLLLWESPNSVRWTNTPTSRSDEGRFERK